ncbi:MAG: thiamine pyrophosphate-binding protein [Rhodospirillales bacterium]|nr:thiamine pyrophosphate-binding protein [Rhodospirillales bacterium]
MAMMAGKTALLELLRQEGVDLMFGNPGTTELPLMDALAGDHALRYVLALQEAPVMAMADGYAQASGKLAVANLHVAPGLGNALGMLYDAQKAGSPILVTAGQHDQRFNLTEPLLWADLPAIARPFVKWSAEVRRVEDLPRAIHRAAKTALAPPMGPVFLSLPGDVLTESGDLDLGAPTRVASGMRADAAAIAQAAALIARAERPIIIAGDAVAQSGALAELAALADAIGAPVYDEGMASRAMFPSSHPLYRGAVVRLPGTIRTMLAEHDLLISIGGDLFTLSLPGTVESVPEGMKIVHLDTDPWELGKNFAEDVALLGDPSASLPELTQAVRAAQGEAGAARAADRRARLAAETAASLAALRARALAAADRSPIDPLALMHAIGQTLPADAVVIDETVSSGTGLRRLLASDDAQSFFGLRGGGIGWGLPAAIGAKLALPDRPVVALVGDGSAMYTIQALWTAAHEKLSMVFVIINNASYRILKQRTHAMQALAAQHDLYVGMDLTEPRIDYVQVAHGLGVAAQRAGTLAEFRAMLQAGLHAEGPLLIDVAVDRNWKPV